MLDKRDTTVNDIIPMITSDFTNGIPICPYCKKPTRRTVGSSSETLMYFCPIYDKEGNNTNPDRNTLTTNWQCLECGKSYQTKGNYVDGFKII